MKDFEYHESEEVSMEFISPEEGLAQAELSYQQGDYNTSAQAAFWAIRKEFEANNKKFPVEVAFSVVNSGIPILNRCLGQGISLDKKEIDHIRYIIKFVDKKRARLESPLLYKIYDWGLILILVAAIIFEVITILELIPLAQGMIENRRTYNMSTWVQIALVLGFSVSTLAFLWGMFKGDIPLSMEVQGEDFWFGCFMNIVMLIIMGIIFAFLSPIIIIAFATWKLNDHIHFLRQL